MDTNIFNSVFKIHFKVIEYDKYIELIPDLKEGTLIVNAGNLHTTCNKLAEDKNKPVIIITDKDKSDENNKRHLADWYQYDIAGMYIGNDVFIEVVSQGDIYLNDGDIYYKDKNGDALKPRKIKGINNDAELLHLIEKTPMSNNKSFHLTVYRYDMSLEVGDINRIHIIYEDDEIDYYDDMISHMLDISDEIKNKKIIGDESNE